jgi:hypothetical protein
MSGTLQVGNIIGPTTGADANKVLIPSGQTLHAPGHVLQVVEGSTNTPNSTSSTSAVNSGLDATITPLSATSKILVAASFPHHCVEEPGPDVQAYLFLKRLISGGSDTELAGTISGDHTGNASRSDAWSSVHMQCLDSPTTTTSITYRVQHRVGNGGWQSTCMVSNNRGSITLMEIAQ